MKKMYFIQLFVVLFALLSGYSQAQTVITEWGFEENPLLPNNDTPAPNVGSGSASVLGNMTNLSRSTGSNTGCSQTSGTGSWAFGTANPGTNESSGAQFLVSTVGYQGIKITYDQRMSNSATRTERIQYTLDGVSWINFNVDPTNSTISCNGSYDNGRFDRGTTVGLNMSDSWSRKTVDFTSIVGANDNPNFGVRIVAAHFESTGEFRQANNSIAIATAGTWRFDNVRFTAAPANVSIITANNFVIYNEDAGTIQVPITVTNANPSPITLTFGLAIYATATAGDDFTWANTLTIPASTNGVFNLPITILDDQLAERTETIIVKILSGNNAAVSPNNYYQIVYVKDNDYQAPVATNEIKMNLLTSFSNGPIGANSAEIVVYDPTTERLYIANSIAGKLDIVNFSNPSVPTIFASIDITPYGGINSVAVNEGLVAVAMENANPQLNGSVVFFNADGVFINQVTVGALPDMITFNKDFTKILTANEGEPSADYSLDPEGSVSIIDLTPGIANLTNANVTNISLAIYNGQEATLLAQGIRIFSTSASVAQDLEPEYIVVSDDNTTAYVALQENNALLVVDLVNNAIVSINALGYSDYSSGNGMDASDQTGQVLITSLPVKGTYMPDAMAYATINGQGYVFTANEGDSREFGSVVDAARISTLPLDQTVFPDQAILKNNRFAGRLNGLNYSGDTDGDGDLDEIHVMGGRSFSIWNAQTADLVFDSKDLFEQILAAHPDFSAIFNASNTASNPSFKNRSDDKGPEPEGVVTAEINGSMYAFVSLERIGGAMIFNVDDPMNPVYVGYENNRLLTGIGPDLGAEGMIFISAEDSPNGGALLILANEVSSTLSVFQINTCAELSNVVLTALDSEICAGDSTEISFVGTPNLTFDWFLNNEIIVDQAAISLDAFESGTYSVFVANPDLACSGKSNALELIVNELPVLEITASSTELCFGDGLTLTAQGADAFEWNNDVENGIEFTPEASATYLVVGTNLTGCSAESEVSIVVNENPELEITASSTELCFGDGLTLTAQGADAFEWTNDVENGVEFTVETSTTYLVVGTNLTGCSAELEVSIVVNENPELEITASSTELCFGDALTLTAEGADMLEWNNDVVNGVEFTPEASATYIVVGTNATGCTSELEIAITINDNPEFTLGDDVTVCVYNLPVVLTAPAGFDAYLWTGDVAGASFTATAAGTYSCTVTNASGCVATESVEVFVSECLGFDVNSISVSVYPNPFDSKITIATNMSAGQILVTDMNGGIVRVLSFDSTQTELDLSALASGVYFIQVSSGSEIYRTRVVKY
jgi:hypothetical protein